MKRGKVWKQGKHYQTMSLRIQLQFGTIFYTQGRKMKFHFYVLENSSCARKVELIIREYKWFSKRVLTYRVYIGGLGENHQQCRLKGDTGALKGSLWSLKVPHTHINRQSRCKMLVLSTAIFDGLFGESCLIMGYFLIKPINRATSEMLSPRWAVLITMC